MAKSDPSNLRTTVDGLIVFEVMTWMYQLHDPCLRFSDNEGRCFDFTFNVSRNTEFSILPSNLEDVMRRERSSADLKAVCDHLAVNWDGESLEITAAVRRRVIGGKRFTCFTINSG